MEIHPYSSWASPTGQRLLDSVAAPVVGADHDVLAAVAVRGVRAVDDPALRAALSGGGHPAHPRTRVTEYSAAGVDVPLDRPKPCGRRIALTVSRTRATCEPAECQGCMAP